MKFRKLGNTDLDVSVICLGTMTWGEQNTQEEAFKQMDYSVDQGINFFDTAELYAIPPKKETYGKTEEIIGNWFEKRKNRKKIILSSKIAGPGLDWIRGGGNQYSEKSIEEAIEKSLKRLKTDYIDLYQLHWPERETNYFGRVGYIHKSNEKEWNNFEKILKDLQKFIEMGKIKYIGISNETPYGLTQFLKFSEKSNLPRVMSVQNPYSLLNRIYEIGLAEISVREKSGLLAYSPLAAGYLSGKYRNNKMPKNSRITLFGEMWKRYNNPNSFKAVDDYYEIAKKSNLSLAQMSLAFVNSRPFVTSTIIGATKMDQLKEDIDSVNVKLDKEIIDKINLVHRNNPNPAP